MMMPRVRAKRNCLAGFSTDTHQSPFILTPRVEHCPPGARFVFLTGVFVFLFSDQAQQRFFEWWQSLETYLEEASLNESLKDYFGKYRSLSHSLSLLSHLVIEGSGLVSLTVNVSAASAAIEKTRIALADDVEVF